MLRFDRFSFDPENLRLEDESGPIRLNHKAFDVLRVLIERRGRLVRKEELLDAVWADTHVSEGVLTVCMTEIRSALGDSASAPRFIETVHRRGYRFIAEVNAPIAGRAQAELAQSSYLAVPAGGASAGGVLVGRARELDMLDEQLARALAGERQVVFVTGEPGAGKTVLVEHFVANASRTRPLAITSGQSLEHFGSTEPYMPVLEAVGRLVREAGLARSLLRRYAPTWFAQLPWLIEGDDGDKLARELLGATRERMLREMGEFVEALTVEIPLVLVLEDLHWCDPSTVDLLSLIASRREPARLLVIATARPVELILGRHPLRAVSRALAASRRSIEVALDHLDVEAVSSYLERRFPESKFPAALARRLHERTDGNPLFMVTVVDDLVARGAILQRDGEWQFAKDLRDELAEVPDTLRLLIEQRLERLDPDDRKLLEAASLVGFEFSAAAAGAGAARPTDEADERCARLAAAGSLLRRTGTAQWPDGTVAGRYAFRHALYRDTLDKGVPARRRADSHLRIGKALETAYGDRVGELAVALAVHFEEGGDRARAIRYRRLAADTAARRHALLEAERHIESGLALLVDLPASPERDREELLLQSALGTVRMATRGYAAPEVVKAYKRALDLSGGTPEDPSVFQVLWGLWSFSIVRGELDRALEIAHRSQAIAEASDDRLMRLVGHVGLSMTLFFRGDLAAALGHLDAAEPLDDVADDRHTALAYGQDQKVVALGQRAILLWHVGSIDRAVEMSERAIQRAHALEHPMSIAFAMAYGSWLRILRREAKACRSQADAVISYATVQGLPHWIPGALHSRGWALAEEGDLEKGIASMEDGLVKWAAIGAILGRAPRAVDLAAAKMRAGQLIEARSLIDEIEASLATTNERYHEPELYRVEADLVLAEAQAAGVASSDARARAADLLEAAIECASRQGSRTLELRAITALARLHRRGAQAIQARERLAACLDFFTEGGDTRDMREARLLLHGSSDI